MQKIFKFGMLAVVLWLVGTFAWGFISPYGVGFGADDVDRVHQQAIQLRDISICDKIHLKGWGDVTDGELRSHCYRTYARAFPRDNVFTRLLTNAPPIETVEGSSLYNDYSLCVDEEAKAERESALCSQLEVKDFYSVCISEVAGTLNDLTICSRLENVAERQLCIERILPKAR